MSNSRVAELLNQGKINYEMYVVYMMFESEERGQNYLNRKVDELFMEQPIEPKKQMFAWYDGRKSIFRDIKFQINVVKKLLEEFEQ